MDVPGDPIGKDYKNNFLVSKNLKIIRKEYKGVKLLISEKCYYKEIMF